MRYHTVPVILEHELREAIFHQYDVEIDIRSLFGMRSHRLDDILDIVYLNGEAEERYLMDLPKVNCVITYLRDVFGGYDYILVDAN